MTSRTYLVEAKKQWQTLSPADKSAWSSYARRNIHTNKREQWVIGRGIDGFVRSSIARQNAGLDPMPALPGDMPPLEPTALDLLPGTDARELVFRIEHKIPDPENHAMLVRMTPSGKSPACAAYRNNLRHVRGVGPNSTGPLPESGSVVRIPDTRFELKPDYEYAIEVRIVRLADGTVSDARYQAARREEAAEEVVAAIASVRTGKPAKRRRPPTGSATRDPQTGRFVSEKSGPGWEYDPDLTPEENARIEQELAAMFGMEKPTTKPQLPPLPPLVRVQETETPDADVEGEEGEGEGEGDERSHAAVNSATDAQEAVGTPTEAQRQDQRLISADRTTADSTPASPSTERREGKTDTPGDNPIGTPTEAQQQDQRLMSADRKTAESTAASPSSARREGKADTAGDNHPDRSPDPARETTTTETTIAETTAALPAVPALPAPILPPPPPGRIAVTAAPGVTVPEGCTELLNLAQSRGLKYFPSRHVKHDWCRPHQKKS